MSRATAGALVVAVAGLLAFAGTLAYEFVWDDSLLVQRSYQLHHWRELPRLLSSHLWAEAQEHSHYYRPLVVLSLFADVQVWGLVPLGFHLTNVLLHVTASLAVLALARRLTGDDLAASLAAVLFAVHPIHSEPVAFVSGRSDVLAALFFALSVWGYVRWRAAGGRAVAVLSLAAFALALGAKEVAVVLPLVLAAHEWTERRPPRWAAAAALRLLPWLGVLALYLGARAAVLGRLADAGGGAWAPVGVRLLSALETAGWYLRLILVPYPAHPYAVLAPVPWPPGPGFWAAMALLAAAVIATLVAARTSRIVFFGAAWFWLTLLPGVGVNLLPVPTTVVGERFLYLPSAGLCLVGGVLLAAALRRPGAAEGRFRPAAALGLAVLVGGCLVLVLWRNEDWRDNYRLYTRMIETAPTSELPRVNLALTQLPLGEVAGAHANFLAAARLAPANPRVWSGLALTAALLGQREESAAHAHRARALAPGAGVLATLGAAALVREEPAEAVADLTASLAQAPNQVHPAMNLAVALSRLGRQAEAEEALTRGRRLAEVMTPGALLVTTASAEVLGRRDPRLAADVWQAYIARVQAQGTLTPVDRAGLAHAERQLARLGGPTR